MTLPDGRTLAYTDTGHPDGPVVMYFHGAPTSRLDVTVFDDELRRRGVRVIAPDRPGYGGSSPQPGRHREDWPADVAALADHLGLQQFGVIGLSSGGPYAVACAALLAQRVTGAAVVAGVSDLGWEGAWAHYTPEEAAFRRLGDEAASLRWCEERYGADGARFLDTEGLEPPPADGSGPDPRLAAALAASVGEAFRQGVGSLAQDMVAQGRPWAFDPGSITVPVLVVHGDADDSVPLAHGRHTAEVVPTASLRVLPGEGHLSIVATVPGLAAELAGVMPTQARLQPLRAEDDRRLEELFAKGLNGPDGTPLNIFGTLAHHPDMLRRWLVFAGHVLSKNSLSPRDRELLILRTGWNCRSRYEFGQHVVIALRCDITRDEIEQVKVGPRGGWSDRDRLLMVAADELHRTRCLSDITWQALGRHYTDQQRLDLVATVGGYQLVAMFLNSTGVELDAGVPDEM